MTANKSHGATTRVIFHVALHIAVLALVIIPTYKVSFRWNNFHDNNHHVSKTSSPSYSTSGSATLRVASWNLRVPFPQDATINLSWSDRRYSIALAIAAMEPDVLLLQEDCYFMNMDLLDTALPPNNILNITRLSQRYERYGLFNRNGQSEPNTNWPENPFTKNGMRDGEHNSIWWNRKRFVNIDNTSFWLSNTPEVAGTSFGEVTGRIVNCVTLRDMYTYEKDVVRVEEEQQKQSLLRFCSTHMPADNVTRQLLSAAVLSKKFEEYESSHVGLKYSFIGGDFNSIPGSETYENVVDRGFVDLYNRHSPTQSSLHVKKKSAVTTCDWFNSSNDAFIDYIWRYNGVTAGGNRQRSKVGILVRNPALVRVPCCDYGSDALSLEIMKQIGLDSSATTDTVGKRTASDHVAVIIDLELVSVAA